MRFNGRVIDLPQQGAFTAEFHKQLDQLGRFNLAIFGKTGVGKSTLVNAVFGEPLAQTGIGAPVTEGSHLYLDQRGTLGLLDTKGVEIGRDDKRLAKDLQAEVTKRRNLPIAEQIHAAWYCVRGMDRRFEDSEAALVTELADLELPVLVVLTQVPKNGNDYHPDAVALADAIEARGLPIVGGRPLMTNAVGDQFTGQSAHGLIDLLQATFRVSPEAVRTALIVAQRVDMAAKAKSAQVQIASTVAAAAGVAAVPIPFADATVLVPLQLAMMARIAHLYNVPLGTAAAMAAVSSIAATEGGRRIATGLVKLVPGAGAIVGGAIGASVASALTAAVGGAWLTVCQMAAKGAFDREDGSVDTDQVREVFRKEFANRFRRRNRD
ncbi:GTP-binding protein [Parenemella sanctibonifatiensis]|uniref:GTP-binding protein n=1 Tax=Parenemella sanctibonifatiensis TaxID=2016505 RepID=A0A255ELU1_9ACTN|nr:GTP-binding protein [Parenemella sanctibonifatiensis]